MASDSETFEFHATLSHLDEGLETLHDSVQRLRDSTGRGQEDRSLLRFEIALAEIGANVLTHGRPAGTDPPVEYSLRLDHGAALAEFIDRGPPAHSSINRGMPDHSSESGRGLPMARSLLDELGYERVGEINKWRLVKRL
ncbi:MAG TPA: ATP-binding protein [Candidatus Dormibacteraeota bacterium]|nr:ATP-binding protein [Candidatus Dormibacteraeota bacterium]